MAKINGTLILLKVDTEGGTPTTLAHVDNATWNSSFSLAEAADKDSAGFQEYLESAGLREASIDIDGNADFTYSSGNQKQLAEYLRERNNIDFVFGPEEAGNLNFTGSALLNEHSIDSPNEETTTFSGTATVNGEWQIIETS